MAPTTRAILLAGSIGAAIYSLTACTNGAPADTDASAPAAVASASTEAEPSTADADFPAVRAAELRRDGGGTWSLDVTISSEYDSAERYADGWRVLTPEGDVLGEHELTHDHADEQPFTRTQTGLEIPDSVSTVTIEGHDIDNGYGGMTLAIELPSG